MHEVEQVRDLQRDDVARLFDQNAFERANAVAPGALRDAARGGGERLLPRCRTGERVAALLERCQSQVHESSLEERDERERLGRVGGGEPRIERD
ncbi:MAG: hypothetical protein MUF79_13315, partial [Burkholderiales bacterium]|nr:hypothetical protein [Burkholderiales bacterium]